MADRNTVAGVVRAHAAARELGTGHRSLGDLPLGPNRKTHDGRARPRRAGRAHLGDGESLKGVAEVRAHVTATVDEKLTGFIGEAAREFRQAADGLESKRRAMVALHRAQLGRRQAETPLSPAVEISRYAMLPGEG